MTTTAHPTFVAAAIALPDGPPLCGLPLAPVICAAAAWLDALHKLYAVTGEDGALVSGNKLYDPETVTRHLKANFLPDTPTTALVVMTYGWFALGALSADGPDTTPGKRMAPELVTGPGHRAETALALAEAARVLRAAARLAIDPEDLSAPNGDRFPCS